MTINSQIIFNQKYLISKKQIFTPENKIEIEDKD
jgi:hypothetical protein